MAVSITDDGASFRNVVGETSTGYPASTANLTLMLWVRFDVADNAAVSRTVYSLNDNWAEGQPAWTVGRWPATGSLNVYVEPFNGDSAWEPDDYVDLAFGALGSSLTLGQWYHLAYVKSGTSHKVYRDGVEVSSGTLVQPANSTGWSQGFEVVGPDPGNQTDWSAAHFRLWTAALTPAEIQAEMASFWAVRTTDLFRDLPLRILDGTDASGHSHHFQVTSPADMDVVTGPVSVGIVYFTETFENGPPLHDLVASENGEFGDAGWGTRYPTSLGYDANVLAGAGKDSTAGLGRIPATSGSWWAIFQVFPYTVGGPGELTPLADRGSGRVQFDLKLDPAVWGQAGGYGMPLLNLSGGYFDATYDLGFALDNGLFGGGTDRPFTLKIYGTLGGDTPLSNFTTRNPVGTPLFESAEIPYATLADGAFHTFEMTWQCATVSYWSPPVPPYTPPYNSYVGTVAADGWIKLKVDGVVAIYQTDVRLVVNHEGDFNDAAGDYHTPFGLETAVNRFTAVELGDSDACPGVYDNLIVGIPDPFVDQGHARVTQAALEILLLGTVPETLIPDTTYASVDLPDPSTYYTGFKDGRVLSFGTATRTLSDLTGQWSANDLTCTLADTDRAVRNVLQQAKGLRETPAIVRMIADQDRRTQGTPTVVFRGALRAWRPRGDLAVELEYTDAVGLKLSRRGKDRESPTRVVTVADFPAAPSTSQNKPIPVIYGAHVWWTGACPVVYIGLQDIGMGVARDTWVVAGHACAGVTALYVDGVEDTNWGTGWFAPGQSGWFGATLYTDINGRRYTCITGQGPAASACAAGTSTLTVNVEGVESVGDGSGALVSQSYLQYLHFFRNFILDNYQGGVWPSTPIEWESGWCQINAQSFVDAQTESKRWVTGDGYTGQAYIGPDRKSIRDWLAVWNTSLNCRLGLNRYHQWTVSLLSGALDPEDIAALPRLTDEQDVLRESLDMEALDDEAITRATISAYRLPSDASLMGGTETYVDRVAEEDAGTEISDNLELDFLSATEQLTGPLPTMLSPSAADVAKRWIGIRSAAPLYRVTFKSGICAYEAVDVGELFRLTHFSGLTALGYVDRILWCESVALDIDARTVTITALDVTHVYEGARTLESLVDPPPVVPGEPAEPPPIGSESGMLAPTGGSGSLIDATLGSAYYGTQSTTVYYKVVAVFDSDEESKPLILGPYTTGADADTIHKRVNISWTVYPTGTQVNPAGATVTPVAMRVYRCSSAGFLSGVVQCDLTQYPVPEAPGNLTLDSENPGATTLYYAASQYYYLVGEGVKSAVESTTSGATVDVEVDYWEDPLIDQMGIPGVWETAVYGRSDSDADSYLDFGVMGWYVDDGSDGETFGSPWAAVTPDEDLPLSATSFYDQWPGKSDTTENPWVTV